MQNHSTNEKQKLAVVLSVFNKDISARLKKSASEELKKHNIKEVKWVEVPGVIEIPLAASWLFEKNYQAVIALGAVIKGETSHFKACCRMVEQGCMQVSLKTGKPLIFGVLMTDNKEQALARTEGHRNIAVSAVQTALKMLEVKDNIK